MKIYNVTFDDGGWHSGPRPNFMIVADSKEEAIEKALKDNPLYSKGYSKWASEFKIDGGMLLRFMIKHLIIEIKILKN